MNDVRDEALGVLLERTATRIESATADRLPEVLRRGSRRRTVRFTAVGAALALFAGGVGWAGLTFPTDDVIPADVSDWRTFASLDENGWTIQVPPPWRIQELPACSNAPERIGVIVTNTDFPFLNPRSESPQCEDRFVFHGFPSDGVAFAFMPRGSVHGLFWPSPDTAFPLSPDLLIVSGGITGGPAESFQSIWLRREPLGVIRRWIGPDATARDVAALDTMLGSFHVRGAPRWVEEEIVQDGVAVTVRYPEGWLATTVRAPTTEDAPTPLMLLTSPRIGGGSCSPFLDIQLGSFRRFGVAVLVADGRTAGFATSPGEDPFPPRPDQFRFRDAAEASIAGCDESARVLSFRFEEAGLPISMTVAATEAVYREQPEMLLHILNSIRIEEA
jgi:hypothetical protein